MEKNDVFELEITGMTDDGSGVGHAEGMAVFVPYTIVGEVVSVRIIKVNKSFAAARLICVKEPSAHRVKSECEYFYKCGGCQLWHMDYEAELEFKYNKVRDCIRRIGGLDTEISDIIPADDIKRYRNKVQLPVSDEGIGFYRRNSHDVIDMEDCLLQKDFAADIVKMIRGWIADYSVELYNEESGKGVLRHLYIRSGVGGIMVMLVTTTEKIPAADELVRRLLGCNPDIRSIACNVNSARTNVVLGKKNINLYGNGYITDKIGETEFKISPNSFYQVNNPQTVKLYTVAKELAKLSGSETIWDLYCGIGTIGQFMADSVKKTVGIEIVPQAVADAEENAKNNGIENAVYRCGAAEKLAGEILKESGRPDVVFLDPPRKGCDERLLKTVIEAKPKRIVYISCKPSTLARDMKFLCKNGCTAEKIVPVDLFPRTAHVETIVLLQNRNM